MQLSTGKHWSLRRMADDNGFFKMASLDQIPPILEPIAAKCKSEDIIFDEVVKFKRLLIKKFQSHSSALLLDPQFAVPGCIDELNSSKGLFVSLEDPSYRTTENLERLSHPANSWSVGKIKRLGGDAVKMLVWYHPNASAKTNQHQQDYAKQVGEACLEYDIPFFLELLSYPLQTEFNSDGQQAKRRDLVLKSLEEFAKPEYNVDVFMLESPTEGHEVPTIGSSGEEIIQSQFSEISQLVNRPWVVLSTGATMTEFNRIMTHAYLAGASGYLAGRSYWLDTLLQYPNWLAMNMDIQRNVSYFIHELNTITDQNALPWTSHLCHTESKTVERSFCEMYPDI